MARQGSAEKRAFWQLAVEMQQESGLTVSKFCEREALNAASFYAWRRKLRRGASQTSPDRSGSGEKAKPSLQLVPVQVIEDRASAAVEVVSPNGLTLRVSDDAATENVRRVLQLLHENV